MHDIFIQIMDVMLAWTVKQENGVYKQEFKNFW